MSLCKRTSPAHVAIETCTAGREREDDGVLAGRSTRGGAPAEVSDGSLLGCLVRPPQQAGCVHKVGKGGSGHECLVTTVDAWRSQAFRNNFVGHTAVLQCFLTTPPCQAIGTPMI